MRPNFIPLRNPWETLETGDVSGLIEIPINILGQTDRSQQTWMQLNTHHLMHENVIFCHIHRKIFIKKKFDLNKSWLLFKLSVRRFEGAEVVKILFFVIAICIYRQGLGLVVTIIITSQEQRKYFHRNIYIIYWMYCIFGLSHKIIKTPFQGDKDTSNYSGSF